MRVRLCAPCFAALLLVCVPSARAQAQSVDPSGHWSGSIQTPNGTQMPFEVDVAKSKQGKLAATYTSPTESVTGLPFLNVEVTGKAVSLQIRESGTLKGDLSADGKAIAGNYQAVDPMGNEIKLPFTLAKTGPAHIDPTPKSPKISKELAGIWNGEIEVMGFKVQLRLKLGNESDGQATGTLTNITRGEAAIPVSEIAQKGTNVTFRVKAVGGTYAGALNADGSEITGNLTQESGVRPLTFKRSATPAASAMEAKK